MTGENSRVPRERGIPRAAVFAVALAAIIVGASLVVYAVWLFQRPDSFFSESELASLNWDGGAWSEPLIVNCNEPSIVEFQGKIYMFYSVVTENTIGGDDVVISPEEHILYDVLYRVFDGRNFTDPVPLSSPTDKVSVSGRYFVFKGELYAVLSEWWISNYTSYETATQVHAEIFDGVNWRNESWPFVEDAYAYHDLKYVVYDNDLWAVWQYMERPVAGHFSNVFGFRTFNGNDWSETRNFTIPTGTPGDWRVTIAANKMWFVWDNLTFWNDPVTQARPHNDVWLGSFDGEGWSNVTLLSASDDNGSNWGFFLSEFNDELFAFWGGQYLDTSEHGAWVWVMRRLNLNSGTLGELTPITPEDEYKLSPSSTRVFDGRLYMLWFSAHQGWKSMIVSFDGDHWSDIYHFDRGYDSDGLFVYDSKLWAYGTDGSSEMNEAGWTYLRGYNRSV